MNRQTAYKVLCVAMFIPAMAGVWHFVKWGISSFDWWFIVPWVAVILFITWRIDRAERRAATGDYALPDEPNFRNDG